MSSQLTLKDRIYQAQRVLSASFGTGSTAQHGGANLYDTIMASNDNLDPEAAFSSLQNDVYSLSYNDYKYLDEKGLREVYQADASRKDVSEQFLAISKTIRNVRSSYFPIEFFLSSADQEQGTSLIAELQNSVTDREPFENTFLRMVGMPALSWSDYVTSEEIHRISPDSELTIIDPLTGNLLRLPVDLVRINILDERKYPPGDRAFIINNDIYNISTETTANIIIPDKFSIEDFTLKERADLFSFKYEELENGDGKVTYTDRNGQVVDVTQRVINVKEISRGTPNTGTDNGDVTGFIDPITAREISPTALARAPLNRANPGVRASNIREITKDMYKFCYLLFPPIQDPEISNAINEPEKLVAPPFSNQFMRKVNSNTLKTTLLESIIRIRLDRISGTSTVQNGQGVDIPVGSDDYGILESVFIVRLQSAISALGSKMIYDIEALINEMDKAKRYPASENENTGQQDNRPIAYCNNYAINLTRNAEGYERTYSEIENDSEEDASLETDVALAAQDAAGTAQDQAAVDGGDGTTEDTTEDSTVTEDIADATLVNLKNQKLIEDSLLFFLQDNKNVLDLQFQTQRSSSIYDSHMMTGLLNIIDVPRKRIEEEIEKLQESRDAAATNVIDDLTGEIGTVFGTDIGIGTLDVAVFCLALFTMSEDSLLGLLTPAQFERMKNGDLKSVIYRERVKKDVLESLDEFVYLVKEGYDLFRQRLDNPNYDISEDLESVRASEVEEGDGDF